MSKYYVNSNAQSTGEHEVHKEGCSRMPLAQHLVYLGDYQTCQEAVRKAKEYYNNVDGCYYCIPACHKK